MENLKFAVRLVFTLVRISYLGDWPPGGLAQVGTAQKDLKAIRLLNAASEFALVAVANTIQIAIGSNEQLPV